jgi:hypothetical protein
VLCLFDFTDVSTRELSEYTSSISEFAKEKPDICFPVFKKKILKKPKMSDKFTKLIENYYSNQKYNSNGLLYVPNLRADGSTFLNEVISR